MSSSARGPGVDARCTTLHESQTLVFWRIIHKPVRSIATYARLFCQHANLPQWGSWGGGSLTGEENCLFISSAEWAPMVR